MGPGRMTASGRSGQRRCAWGGVVAARERAWDACAREEVPRGGQVALRGFPGSIWPRARGGRRRTAGGGKTEHREEREVKVRAYL